ncbi:MAG TPA: helix-hairpin-helix domain-containing protein [Terracidiphilus sp.]|nr:helix-hairpin-helix domain-containing protein [Terracidiphilus sp.]
MRAKWKPALLAAWIVLAGAAGSVQAEGRSEHGAQSAHGVQATLAPEARVDINHATVDELMTVPGMTHTWAGRIVRFRPYRTKQDLVDKGVVTSQVYDRIKDYIIAHRDKP